MKKSLADRVLSPAFIRDLQNSIRPFNAKATGRKGQQRDCSRRTRIEREKTLLLAFAELAELGYRLQKPSSFRQKHLTALTKHWGEKGLAAKTLHSRLSVLRVFASWLGKRGVVGDIEDYYPPEMISRTMVATENKAWQANGVQAKDVIDRARHLDERLALYLTLQDAFGLRVKESIEMRPLRAITTGDQQHLAVAEGTKGGKPRLVPIQSEEQRAAIEWACRVAMAGRSGRLRWPDTTWEQAQARFYYLLRKLGITRADLGVTAHGLRHQYSQHFYRRETGLPTPIEGGALGLINRQTHKAVTIRVSMALGHGREDVVGNYYGSYGHSLRSPGLKLGT